MRFRRALDRGDVTEALSATPELKFVGLAEALELWSFGAEPRVVKARRAIRAVRLLAQDGRIPRPLRLLAALGLLPIPGPIDEGILLLVAAAL